MIWQWQGPWKLTGRARRGWGTIYHRNFKSRQILIMTSVSLTIKKSVIFHVKHLTLPSNRQLTASTFPTVASPRQQLHTQRADPTQPPPAWLTSPSRPCCRGQREAGPCSSLQGRPASRSSALGLTVHSGEFTPAPLINSTQRDLFHIHPPLFQVLSSHPWERVALQLACSQPESRASRRS